MRIFLSLAALVALLSSQIVMAAPPRVPCFTVIETVRAERLIKYDKDATCDPTFIPTADELTLCPNILSRSIARRALRQNLLPLCLPSASTTLPTSSSSSSMSSSSFSSSSSSSSSALNATFDTRDTTLRSQLALLGEVSPVIGAAALFSNDEPLDVKKITVALQSEVLSVQSILVYDDQKRYLGRASLDPSISTKHYSLQLASGMLTLEKRVEKTIYLRADLRSKDTGGESNANMQIALVTIQANGVWSSAAYTQNSTNTNFPIFRTARSVITSVTNPLAASAPLLSGTNRVLGSFVFTGRVTDSSAKLEITDLVFQIGATNQVTLSNVQIVSEGFTDRYPCSVGASTVTCAALPSIVGSLTDAPRRLTLYGDITITGGQSASLQLSLNEQGTATTAGSVTWFDGTNAFTWVPLSGVGGIANGTYYSY